MRISINEFFNLLKKGLSLRGSNPRCGRIQIETHRGKKWLVMRWPEDSREEVDEYGDFVPAPTHVEKISLEKFEYFAARIFHGVEVFMGVDADEDVGTS